MSIAAVTSVAAVGVRLAVSKAAPPLSKAAKAEGCSILAAPSVVAAKAEAGEGSTPVEPPADDAAAFAVAPWAAAVAGDGPVAASMEAAGLAHECLA